MSAPSRKISTPSSPFSTQPCQSIGAREAKDERAKSHALHHAANFDGTGTRHRFIHAHDAAASLPADLDHFAVLDQTAGRSLAVSRARACARGPRDRLPRRIRRTRFPSIPATPASRCVYGQLAVPKSSSFATAQHLQSLADDVIDRGLHFLNARNVIATARSAENPPARAAEFRRRRSPAARRSAASRLRASSSAHDDVPRSAAGGNADRHVFGPRLRDQLPQKNHFGADVVGDRGDIRRLERKRNRGNRQP